MSDCAYLYVPNGLLRHKQLCPPVTVNPSNTEVTQHTCELAVQNRTTANNNIFRNSNFVNNS